MNLIGLKPLLFTLLAAIAINEASAGLAVDQVFNPEESSFGDACDYEAFKAFRLPILHIMIEKYGEYETMNVMMYRFEEFNFKVNGTTVTYDHVPPKYLDKICASKVNPLMCQPPASGDGPGKCMCLEMDVVETLENNSTVVHRIRTRPFTYRFNYSHQIDLAKLDEYQRQRSAEAITDDDDDISSTPAPTSDAADAASRRKRSDEADTNTTYNEGSDDGRARNENMDMRITYTRCLARPYSFCGPPFIACQPYETHRHRLTTSCVYARCGSNSLTPEVFLVLGYLAFQSYLMLCNVMRK